MSFLGVDIGASFIKGAWLDIEKGRLIGETRVKFPAFIDDLPKGVREVDVEEILVKTTNLIMKMLSSRLQCDGLLISGQMHGFVLVDEIGETKGNFCSWQDTRTLQCYNQIGKNDFENARKILGDEVITELGNEFRPGSPAAVLYSLSRSGILERGFWAASLPDYVAYRITGKKNIIHATNAAAHGLYNITESKWHSDAIQRLGLNKLCFPEVTHDVFPVGKGVLSGIPFDVFTPVGDQQAALLGSGLMQNQISVNIATGSQVSRIVADSSSGPWQTRPYFKGKTLRTITHLPAGRALNSLVSLFEELCPPNFCSRERNWGLISKKTNYIQEVAAKVDISFFPCATGTEGSIMNLKEEELTIGHLFLAAFRSMAENYANAADKLAPGKADIVVLSGGLVQKLPVLVREIRNAMRRECRLASHGEDALLGLLRLASWL